MMKSFNVIGLGALNADFIHTTKGDNTTSYEAITATAICAGGAASNTICALSRLGLICGVAGRIGVDKYSRLLIDNLDDFGVDYFEVAKDRRSESGQAQIFINPYGKCRISINPGANNLLEKRHLDLFYMKDTQWMHYTSFLHEKQIDAQVKIASQLTGITQSSYYIDAHMIPFSWNSVRRLFPYIRHVIVDAHVLAVLTGYEGKEGAKKILYEGSETVAIIYGPSESEIITKDAAVHTKTKKQLIVDMSGMQDAFSVGFIYGQSKGYGLKQTALLSHKLMSSCVKFVGPRRYLLNQNAVWQTKDN